MLDPKPRVLMPLSNGVEELEAVAVVDVLRRGGCQVITATVGAQNPVVGRNRIRLMADLDLADALLEWGHEWELVVLPGGLRGVEALEADERLLTLLRERVAQGQKVAAICAAPRVLAAAGLPADTPITGHPGTRSDLAAFSDYREEAVVDAGAVITSRGAGTAVDFGLACLSSLLGPDAAQRVREGIVAA